MDTNPSTSGGNEAQMPVATTTVTQATGGEATGLGTGQATQTFSVEQVVQAIRG